MGAGTYVAANRLTSELMELCGRRWGWRALIILSAGIASSRRGTSVLEHRRFFSSRPWLAMVQLWACEWGGGDEESFSVDSEWFWLFLGCSFIGFFIHFLRFSICGFWIAKFSLISWIFNELFCPIVSQWKGGGSSSVETFMCPQASVEKRWKEFDWAVWFCDFNKLNLLQLFLDFHDIPNWFFLDPSLVSWSYYCQVLDCFGHDKWHERLRLIDSVRWRCLDGWKMISPFFIWSGFSLSSRCSIDVFHQGFQLMFRFESYA